MHTALAVVNFALMGAMVAVLALLLFQAARWGSHDRPDVFLRWHKATEAFPHFQAAQAAFAHVEAEIEAGIEAIEETIVGTRGQTQEA